MTKLRVFEQMCIVTKEEKINVKLRDRRGLGFMTGYFENHSRGTYRVFMLYTYRVVKSRDILWLNLY